jgi:cytochrome c oxidase assembly factor CtaG
MDPLLGAALSSWDWRPAVIVPLLLAGSLYGLGWRRLRRRRQSGPERHNAWNVGAAWRPIAYGGGLVAIVFALLSPIDVLASQLFLMHMIQHVLLMMVAPPLLLLANPLPYFLWALPAVARLQLGGLLNRDSKVRHFLRRVGSPGLVWMLYVVVYIGWHDPALYNLALQNSLVHDLEHLTFFGVAMLYWWLIVGAGPRVARPFSHLGRIAFVVAAIPPSMFAGIAIAFAREPLYGFYEAMPRLWGLSVLDDQRISGVIMWVFGSMMYMITILILVARWLKEESAKPPLPEGTWATKENLLAPGWKK